MQPQIYLLGNRMTDASWLKSQSLYDSYSLTTMAHFLLFRPPPSLADLAIRNRCTDIEDRATFDRAAAWFSKGCPLEGNPDALPFLWKDHANCRPPQAIAKTADYAADLLLQRDPMLEELVAVLVAENGCDEGEAVDLDLSNRDYWREYDQARPNLIWTMRGVAKAARLAEAEGSDLLTMVMEL